MNRKMSGQAGMTLIEILIVITILGLVMTLVGSRVYKQFAKAKTNLVERWMLIIAGFALVYPTGMADLIDRTIGDQIRVSSKSKDDLQTVIQFVKNSVSDLPLQFINYR